MATNLNSVKLLNCVIALGGLLPIAVAEPPSKDVLVTTTPNEAKPKWLTYKLSVAGLLDYTFFNQDAKSVAQVKEQRDQGEIRDLRITLSGTMGSSYHVGYQLALGYNGIYFDRGERWTVFDFNVTLPTSDYTKFIIGKTKETFDYEMVSLAAFGSAQERVLNPFFTSRNVGVRIQHYTPNKKMTMAGGIYNDWFLDGESPSDSGTDVTGRFTYLPQISEDGKRYLHLGVGARYVGAVNGQLQYRGRPGSNVSDYYIDTGKFNADHAFNAGVEGLWNQGPFSILAEYNKSWASSQSNGNPEFYGYYILCSYILSGENRPYDPTVGYTRGLKPASKRGAFELVGRFASVNLDDGPIQGGKFDNTYLGVNWWAEENWKVGFGWTHTSLDRFGTTGKTDAFLCRLQYVF